MGFSCRFVFNGLDEGSLSSTLERAMSYYQQSKNTSLPAVFLFVTFHHVLRAKKFSANCTKDFCGKNVPKSPDFEILFFLIAIFRQQVQAGGQDIAGFVKFSTFLSDH